jgi:hypothetical protein
VLDLSLLGDDLSTVCPALFIPRQQASSKQIQTYSTAKAFLITSPADEFLSNVSEEAEYAALGMFGTVSRRAKRKLLDMTPKGLHGSEARIRDLASRVSNT